TTGKLQNLIWFATLAVVAALTKANALALVFAVPLAICLSGHTEYIRSRAFWLVSVAAVAMIALWYVPTSEIAGNGTTPTILSLWHKWHVLKFYLTSLTTALGLVTTALAGLGAIIAARRMGRARALSACALGYVLGWLFFHAIAPVEGD